MQIDEHTIQYIITFLLETFELTFYKALTVRKLDVSFPTRKRLFFIEFRETLMLKYARTSCLAAALIMELR